MTFRALFQRVDVRPLADGLAAVFNDGSSAGAVVEVLRIVVRPPSATGTLSTASVIGAKVSLYRITAMSGGEAVTAIERDTASASLPAQVTCAIFPDSVTISGAALRSLSDAPSLTLTQANSWTTARTYGGSYYSYQRGSNADAFNQTGDSTVERIVLREGQGVALVLDAYGQPRSGQVGLTVRNESTGATYQFRSRAIGHPYLLGQAMIGILNGSGSGVVLSVAMVQYPNDGEHNLPAFRIARIEGVSGGDVVTPIAHDTDTFLPPGVTFIGGDMETTLIGTQHGVPYDWQVTHGATGMSIAAQQKAGTFGWRLGGRQFPMVGSIPSMGMGEDERVIFDARQGDGLRCKAREGIALLAGRGGALETSTFAYFDVEFTVFAFDNFASSYPAEGDVRDGVNFGPSLEFFGTLRLPQEWQVLDGVEYDNITTPQFGTVVLPIPSDVRLGVGYGADGIDLFGTLDPGGGGGTGTLYLRRR